MTDKVERLGKLKIIWRENNGKYFQFLGETRAKAILKAGYIHKSEAVDYCEVCKKCEKGYIPDDWEYSSSRFKPCSVCHGTGIVLRKDK